MDAERVCLTNILVVRISHWKNGKLNIFAVSFAYIDMLTINIK